MFNVKPVARIYNDLKYTLAFFIQHWASVLYFYYFKQSIDVFTAYFLIRYLFWHNQLCFVAVINSQIVFGILASLG